LPLIEMIDALPFVDVAADRSIDDAAWQVGGDDGFAEDRRAADLSRIVAVVGDPD
jgi:hypothetical protein